MATVHAHPFEAAGLGRAPFRFVGTFESVYAAAPGHAQPGGTCDYCGQGIRYCCAIESHDGRRFTVGRDCVRKVGRADNRLLGDMERAEAERKQAERDAKRQARWAELEARRKAKLDEQRARNGGLTDAELAEREQREREAAAAAANQWLIDALRQATPGSFVLSMFESLHRNPLADLPDRAVEILRDIYAKTVGGRRGSKAYEAAANAFDSHLGH